MEALRASEIVGWMDYFTLHPMTRSLELAQARPAADKTLEQQRAEWSAFKTRLRAARPDLVRQKS